MSLMEAGQVIQHMVFRLRTGGSSTQHRWDNRAPRLAVGPAARLAVDHPMPQRSLGVVVRRLHALDSDERPQVGLAGQQLPARPRRLGATARRTTAQILTE